MADDDEVPARFAKDTARHELTVLRDDGLYRHLRFRQPADPESKRWTGAYWFDLVTWPGNLVINGDMETFAFAREEDMFGFFRGHKPNPGYWAEKLRAPRPRDVREFSNDHFRQHVLDVLSEAEEAGGIPGGLREAVQLEVLEHDETSYEDGARRVLADFRYGIFTFTGTCSCGDITEGLTEDSAPGWHAAHLLKGHKPRTRRTGGFLFEDTWEWDLSDWSYQFLWCCHAIPWGIAKYDEAKRTVSPAAA